MSGTTLEVSVNQGISFQHEGVYDVKAYGAKGDGVTDDTGAMQAAIDACVTAVGGIVMIPSGSYLISSALTVEHDTNYGIKIEAYGATIFAATGHADDILRIGSSSARSRDVSVYGGRWELSTRDWTDTCGINLLNAVNCRLTDVIVYNCEKGIALRGTGAKGCVYNVISNPLIRECGFGIHLSCDASNGWVNANNVYGGLVTYSSVLDAVDMAGYYALAIIPDASYDNIPNSNTFYGIALEISGTHSGTMPGGVNVTGYQHAFDHVRTEGFDTPIYSFGTVAEYIKIRPTPASGNTVESQVAIADILRVNIYTNTQRSISGGSATDAIMNLRSTSGNYKAIELFETTGTTPKTTLWSNGQVDCRAIELDVRNAPAAPNEGTVYYDATANKLMVYTGAAWETITSA